MSTSKDSERLSESIRNAKKKSNEELLNSITTKNNLFEYLQIDIQLEEMQKSIDIYNRTKKILSRTKRSLGIIKEYELTSISTSNNYNIPSNERYSTH